MKKAILWVIGLTLLCLTQVYGDNASVDKEAASNADAGADRDKICGCVVDPLGTAVEGAAVKLFVGDKRYQTMYQRWKNVASTKTDANGCFELESQSVGIYGVSVLAEGFAPYINTGIEIPDDANKLSKIVLQKGTQVHGTVYENKKAQPEVSVVCDLRHHYGRNSIVPTTREIVTDVNGKYSFTDLPAGVSLIFAMSADANVARMPIISKSINLKPGERAVLDFGNEEGFTVTGQVKKGDKPLEGASVSFGKDMFSKGDVADSNGFFKVTGLEAGRYTVYATYENKLTDRQEMRIDSDTTITINFGESTISGRIPDEFIGDDNVFLIAKRWNPQKVSGLSDVNVVVNWGQIGSARPDANGYFEISNLKSGRYFLVLHGKDLSEVLAISKIFGFDASEGLDNVVFEMPTAKLRAVVIDAETKEPVPNAYGLLSNEREFNFFGPFEGGQTPNLYTDVNGLIKYEKLPEDIYEFTSAKKGYLTERVADIKIDEGDVVDIEVPLEKGAVVEFALDEKLNDSIVEPIIYLVCKAVNIETNKPYTVETRYGKIAEHTVYLKMPREHLIAEDAYSYLSIPGGKYRIEYRLFKSANLGTNYYGQEPLLTGQVEVNVKAGQTTTIVIEGD